jgi:ribosomal protein S18 acetylase RimI-like enzyme
MNVEIVPLTERHFAAVSAMHQAYLPTPLSGLTGRRLLSHYYAAVAEGRGACGYVAEERGRAVGYVCGVWDAAAVRRSLLRKHVLPLGWWAALHVLRQPHLLRGFITRTRGTGDSPSTTGGYELRPIIVLPEARGGEAARALVFRLAEDAAERGYREIHLFTEAGNVRARKFYAKAGFHQTETLLREGVNCIRYIFPVAGSAV